MRLGNRSMDEWVAQYATSHQNPFNRFCHTIGIPLIALSIPILVAAIWIPNIWKVGLGMFVTGWILQFAGHFAEGKPPEFFSDWRFLFVGLRWWMAKMAGRA